ncbi:hypothetical protein L6Q96_19220 [Candidatus Binatia bacterium]|nr:hypothetical protein [Candidatus Binatia bacterium]
MQTRWIAIGFAALAGWLVPALGLAAATDQVEVKAADGRVFGTIVFCNDCARPTDKGPCDQGAENGWLQGKPCGQCFVKANPNVLIRYPFDIHVTGKLQDAKGQPVKERFVKLFLPNGWGVRTRTLDDGTFRMMLGATAEREGKTPLTVDIGAHTDSKRGEDPYFAMFMLPQSYNPCSPEDAPTGKKPAAAKPKAQKL